MPAADCDLVTSNTAVPTTESPKVATTSYCPAGDAESITTGMLNSPLPFRGRMPPPVLPSGRVTVTATRSPGLLS